MAGHGGCGPSSHYRQLEYPDCPLTKKHFDAKRWFKRVRDNNPYSTCDGCDNSSANADQSVLYELPADHSSFSSLRVDLSPD